MKASALKPGDVVNIYGERFTVKSVHTSGGSTTILFEDVPTTKERCDALRKFSRDTGCITAMLPVQPPRMNRYCDWPGWDLRFPGEREEGEKA